MAYVRWLAEVGKNDIPLAGGKGANMGEMIRIGMPVPPGFVVTTAAFERLVQQGGAGEKIRGMVSGLDVEDTALLISTSKKIKDLIASLEFPSGVRGEILDYYGNMTRGGPGGMHGGTGPVLVAVRSSATAEDLPGVSFAGQQASFLNVGGGEELVDAVKKCWASLYEPRAIFYREKHGFRNPGIAVLVQEMVDSAKSGVMFTVDPVSGEDVVVIEAIWGLGEYLVLGEISPDHYVAEKSGKILREKIGVKPVALVRDRKTGGSVQEKVSNEKAAGRVLDGYEILQLVRYGIKLETYYGVPQDVEFAIDSSGIKIVQTRPVTTRPRAGPGVTAGTRILGGMGASPGIASGRVRIVRDVSEIARVGEGDILVTAMTSPDIVPRMSRSAAIITDLGGATSHAAIVSREMGIPAIVGTGNATKILRDGQVVTVDAYEGIVYEGVVPVGRREEAAPAGKTRTKVKVNIAFADKLDIASVSDGVGLLRIEHMVSRSGIHPAHLVRSGMSEKYIEILTSGIRPVAERFYPRPVWVRTLDARSDEFRGLEGGQDEPHEDNPMLGWHGIRRSLDEPELLGAELEAVRRMRAAGLDNIHVMLPFVVSVDEFRRARKIAGGISMGEGFKLGIMVETPACALSIEDFCREGIGFASFGTNDLTMLTLGVDRNNAKIAKLHSEFHPSVLYMLYRVIDVCNRYGIESSICGEAGSNPEMVRLLVGRGIGSVSCNMDAVGTIRQAVLSAETESKV